VIKKSSGGFEVLGERKLRGKQRKLGGPYPSKEQAVKRLRQVEFFKKHKK
jgi:hypothetical protein